MFRPRFLHYFYHMAGAVEPDVLTAIGLARAHSIASSAREWGRRDRDTESFLGLLFIASARYRIKFAHTAKYKTKPHATAIRTNQIAIFPNLGTAL
jgi:hypothetical protein